MDNNISIKYIFKKDYAELEEHIRRWYNAICRESGLCLAISRKAPRLLEWCAINFGEDIHNQSSIITELALPFIDIEKYEGSCVVIDEAIYHGTTFKKVTSITKTVCQNNPFLSIKSMPMVITDEALLSEEIRANLYAETIINRCDCQFFINSIISKFLTLGKPYDLEFPIFYVDFKEKITTKQIEQMLRQLSAIESESKNTTINENIYYETKTYSRENNENYSSFSYLTDYLYKGKYGRNKPEFSKLRMFYKGNRLCIVSMSPHILSGDDLVENNGMLQGDLQEIWKTIYHSIKSIDNETEEYLHQKKKSMVVMTNYLLSFANFLYVKDSIKIAIKERDMCLLPTGSDSNRYSFRLELQDLIYLVGEKLAEKILSNLNLLLNYPHQINQNIIPSPILADIQYNSIPLDYRSAYEIQISSDNIHSSKHMVSTMMSSMFSAMHSQIELPSRMRTHSFNRLRFGESYRSIINRFSLYYTNECQMYKEIHQCMDRRIDFGSIVPNYIQRNASFGSSYWLRMFRSGENEDFNKDRILRQIVTIIKCFLSYNKGTILHLFEFEFIMALLYCKEQENIKSNKHSLLFGTELKMKFSQNMYQSYVELENINDKVSLVEYAKRYQILTEDEQHFLKLADNSYVKELSNGSAWSTAEDEMIDKYVNYVYSFTQRNPNPLLIRETLNYLFFEKMNFMNDLNNWIKRMEKDIKMNANINIGKKEKEFKSLFFRLPEPFLKLTKENFETEDKHIKFLRENIYQTIQTNKSMLLNNSTFDKIMLSYYIINLWHYYKDKTTARDFDIDDYKNHFDYFLVHPLKFADGVYMHSWLKEEGSFDKVQMIDVLDLQSRLIQILKEIA